MTDYIDGKDLKALWGKRGFELFAFLKEGLQPYTPHGKKITDTDTLERGRRNPIEYYINELHKLLDLARGEQETGTVMIRGQSTHTERRTDRELVEMMLPVGVSSIEQQAKKDFEKQPLVLINPPRHRMSFTLPNDAKEASKVLLDLNSLLFKKDEASEFAEKQGLPRLDIAIGMPMADEGKSGGPTSPSAKKLRPNQQARIDCQKIAKKVWDKYPVLDIVHVRESQRIKNVVGWKYKDKTVYNWLKEVAPLRARKPGKRDKKTRSKQEIICKTLGIK